MTPATLLILILLFQVKHLLADFIWQTGWMVRNKGTYGHLGGIAHAGLHGLLTVPVLIWTPMTVWPSAEQSSKRLPRSSYFQLHSHAYFKHKIKCFQELVCLRSTDAEMATT
mgnify:CR=1 FL=1